ncbi:unnamed protein product [Pleuronectes platessa]|uniref:Uncharacterized protein n=1 Tax=Pleuronectes platessa TaxID=8262 RepID=A0A9N7VDD6_PLEPL|nr:unnamed protein product [Pleuronectes platessa]
MLLSDREAQSAFAISGMGSVRAAPDVWGGKKKKEVLLSVSRIEGKERQPGGVAAAQGESRVPRRLHAIPLLLHPARPPPPSLPILAGLAVEEAQSDRCCLWSVHRHSGTGCRVSAEWQTDRLTVSELVSGGFLLRRERGCAVAAAAAPWWCGGGNLTQSCVLGMTSLGGPVEVQCPGIAFAAGIGGRNGAEGAARMSPESLFYLACDGEIQINSCQSGGPQGQGLRQRGEDGNGSGMERGDLLED